MAKRLKEEVGINLGLIPENYAIVRDQTAIGFNTCGGMDWPTWYLAEAVGFGDYSPEVHVDGKPFNINSATPASRLIKAKKIEYEKEYNIIKLYDG